MGRRESSGTPPDTGADVTEIGVFTMDTSLTIRTWDGWLSRATGVSADAARGRPLTEIVPDLARRGLLAPFEQVLERGAVEILAPAFHQYLIPCPPGAPSGVFDRMQQRVTIGALREDGGIVGVMVAIEDVTARVERERELAARLSSLDPDVRLDAAHRLASAEPVEGEDPLLPAIGDENWRVRRAAVTALQHRKTAELVARVLQALREDHRNFSVLSSAIELLAAGEVDIVEPLVDLLGSPDADLRIQAALVLGSQGDSRAVAALIEALGDPDENVRFHAIEALGRLKAAASVEPLLAFAESGDFFLAFPALEALSHIGDSTVAPRLVPLLGDELLRGAAAEVLGSLGDQDAIEPLTRLLNEAAAPTAVVAWALSSLYDRYEERYQDGEYVADLVRRAIAPAGTQGLLDAIQHAGADELPAIARVLGWLEGAAVERALTRLLGQPTVRSKAIESLVRHGEGVVELLVEQLDAEDLETRHAAVVGLGRIGDRRATAPLLGLLARDPALTVVTAGALARIGDPRAFEPLLGLLGHPDAAVRQAVIAALNSIGHPAMAPRVAPLLRDAQPRVRESAVRIAGYFGYPECAGELLACSRDVDAAVRRAALEHLAFLDDERVAPALIEALGDPDPTMRGAAVQALARLGDDSHLVGALSDRDPWVRYFAARALGDRRHAPSLDELTRLALDDDAGHVRLAAIDALGRIGHAAAVPVLTTLMASDDPERATAAIRALGGAPAAEASRPLRTALRNGDTDRRAAAAEAIARAAARASGDASCAPSVLEAIECLEWAAAVDSDGLVVSAALQGLASIAGAAPPETSAGDAAGSAAVRAIVGIAADETRAAVVIAALASLPEARIGDVAQGLRDQRPPVRTAVVQALGRMRRSEASRWLQIALDDQGADVRLAAIGELRRLGTRGVERRLVTLARTDPDPVVRRAALAALKGATALHEASTDGVLDPASGGGA